MNIDIKVSGDKELARKLLNTAIVQREFEEAATKSAVAVHGRVSQYPVQRHSTDYVRTGTLGRNWGFKVRPYATFVDAFVENPVEYAPYVQGADTQAWMHKGRWPTTRQALTEMRQKIRGFYDTATRNIRRIFDR